MAQADIYRKAVAEATKLLLKKDHIEKTTVEEICAEAAISRRSFYRYFIDKYDVLCWIVDREFFDSVELQPGKSFLDHYATFLTYIYENRDWFLNALIYSGQNSLKQHLFQRVYPIICYDFQVDFPSEYWREFAVKKLTELAFESLIWWMEEKEPIGPEEMIDLSVSVLHPFVQNLQFTFKKYGESSS